MTEPHDPKLPLFDGYEGLDPIHPLDGLDAKLVHPSARAAAFHRVNPHVLVVARSIAMRLVRKGVRHGSINMLFEVMRYRYLETHGDKYKLNNSYRAWYARELMATTPDLAGWFETRDSPHDPAYHDREDR